MKFSGEGSTLIARWRLEKYLSIQKEGVQSEEFEAVILMKNGFVTLLDKNIVLTIL